MLLSLLLDPQKGRDAEREETKKQKLNSNKQKNSPHQDVEISIGVVLLPFYSFLTLLWQGAPAMNLSGEGWIKFEKIRDNYLYGVIIVVRKIT